MQCKGKRDQTDEIKKISPHRRQCWSPIHIDASEQYKWTNWAETVSKDIIK